MSKNLTPENAEASGSTMSGALGGDIKPDEEDEKLKPLVMGGSAAPATIGGGAAASPSVTAMPKQQKAGTGTFANLKSYLQAAQGGGRVAQAATQRVQNVGTSAQKGLQQAGQAFERKVDAGSLANLGTAGQEASGIIGAATGVTYQAPQTVAPTQTEPRRDINPHRTNPPRYEVGINPPIYDFWKDKTTNPDGTITYKDGTPLAGKSLAEFAKKQQINAEEIAPLPTQPQAPAQTQQYFTPEQTQRFADIINAQYQGPASLQQAGLYESAAQKARVAQEAATKSQTAGGRESLLRDIFSRGRDYSRGASKLDALLLNTSQQGVEQLQQQATEAGKSQERLQALQNLSAAQAQGRSKEIQQVREGARGEFEDTRGAEEQAVNERLSKVVENWDQLPEYFRQILRDKEKGNLALTEQEAGLLGVTAGQGLYNLTADDIVKTQAAEQARLITKDELSRQLALQQLANLDVSKGLQKDLLYTDLEKAGTQTSEDALDKKAIQDVLKAEEERFQETAAGQNIVGTGSKKHSQTGKRYYADARANLKDLLQKAGYTFGSDAGISPEGVASGASGSLSRDEDQLGFAGEALSPYGSGSSTAEQAATAYSDLATGGLTAGLRGLGVDITGAISRNLGGTKSSRYAKNIAARQAQKDLQRRVKKELDDAGFSNRAAVRETKATEARKAALDQILADRTKLRG